VSGEDLAPGLTPEYASSKTVGGIDFDVYKRVRECAGCGEQFVTFEITEQELDLMIDHVGSPDETPKFRTAPKTKLQQFKAWVRSLIMKKKLPLGG
jgi:transcriptional regulator NrdR family protein